MRQDSSLPILVAAPLVHRYGEVTGVLRAAGPHRPAYPGLLQPLSSASTHPARGSGDGAAGRDDLESQTPLFRPAQNIHVSVTGPTFRNGRIRDASVSETHRLCVTLSEGPVSSDSEAWCGEGRAKEWA